MKGQKIMDRHHVAGSANSPVVVTIPTNDHRAVLSVAQYDWPKLTLENPEGCPLLAAAGCIRGFVDTVKYLIDELLLWVAEALEWLSDFLTETAGSEWWLGTPLARFARKGKSK